MGKRRSFPHCDRCDAEVNPLLYEFCDEMYRTDDGECVCRECFLSREREYLELNPREFAELIGVEVIDILTEEEE